MRSVRALHITNSIMFIYFIPVAALEVNASIGEVIIKLGRLLDEDVIIGEALAYELSQLEMSQLTRFERLSELTDIEECIPNIQKASSGDHQWPYRWYLSNLAQGVRFERLGELTDLEQAVSNLHRAVQLID
jgi:hypothetical protein